MKRNFQDSLDLGVDFTNRRIYIGDFLLLNSTSENENADIGNISSRSMAAAFRALKILSETTKPIEIYVSSYGGDVESMLGFYDLMKQTRCKLKGFASGKCMSAATVILAGCDERISYENTSFMFHDISFELINSKIHDHSSYLKEAERIQKRLYKILWEETGISEEFWSTICKKDFYMTPEEALKLGFIHQVLKPISRLSYRKPNKKPDQSYLAELKRRI